MALQHSIVVGGTTYPEAYSRISVMIFTKGDAQISVNTYQDKGVREQELTDPTVQPLLSVTYQTTPEVFNGPVFEQGYVYLKTLPDFAGSIDV